MVDDKETCEWFKKIIDKHMELAGPGEGGREAYLKAVIMVGAGSLQTMDKEIRRMMRLGGPDQAMDQLLRFADDVYSYMVERWKEIDP